MENSKCKLEKRNSQKLFPKVKKQLQFDTKYNTKRGRNLYTLGFHITSNFFGKASENLKSLIFSYTRRGRKIFYRTQTVLTISTFGTKVFQFEPSLFFRNLNLKIGLRLSHYEKEKLKEETLCCRNDLMLLAGSNLKLLKGKLSLNLWGGRSALYYERGFLNALPYERKWGGEIDYSRFFFKFKVSVFVRYENFKELPNGEEATAYSIGGGLIYNF